MNIPFSAPADAPSAMRMPISRLRWTIAYAVAQRSREIGIRLALGASAGALKGMFVRHGLRLVAVGVACGLVVAAGLTRVMTALLFGISPLDPTTYAGVGLVLAVAAALASYLPARRAAAVDPILVLRSE